MAVRERLNSRGIQCDPVCPRCEEEIETINHVFFECTHSLYTWGVSPVSINHDFPQGGLYSNMDYLLSKLKVVESQHHEKDCYPWILGYIWKSRNRKVFEDVEIDPPDIIEKAIKESKACAEAQNVEEEVDNKISFFALEESQNVVSGLVCQVDGSWKSTYVFEGLGWICINEDGSSHRMGTSRRRRGLSPLHTEFGALLWAMEVIKARNISCQTFESDSTTLVAILQSPTEWPAFKTMIEEFEILLEHFTDFRIKNISRDRNSKAVKLARSGRVHPLASMYVSEATPSWVFDETV